jgi:hypothetical protein
MMADPSAHPGKGMILLEELKGFLIFPLAGERDEALNTDMGRTGNFARRCSAFVNGISSRNCLGVLLISCLPVGQSFIISIGNADGAYLRAFSAACAFGKINKPRLFPYPGSKMPRIALKTEKFCICDEFYIQMPADLDQFRRDDSHGTVIGGKGLVQLGHQPAYG